MTYRYRLSSTGASSDRYGVCEPCGLHSAEVFIQTETRVFQLSPEAMAIPRVAALHPDGFGETYHQCRTLFGHEDCLVRARR